MAKARRIKSIQCTDPVVENARKIIEVRLDEMYSFAGSIYDRERIEDIHNLRIAAKRLRYTLEMFRFAFPKGLKPLIKEVKEIQEHIGNMRDADVMIERVRGILEKRAAERSDKLFDIATAMDRGTIAQRRQRVKSAMVTPTGTRDELAYYTLIAHRIEESSRAYQQFLEAWERLEDTDFHGRLRRFAGIDPPLEEPVDSAPSPNGAAAEGDSDGDRDAPAVLSQLVGAGTLNDGSGDLGVMEPEQLEAGDAPDNEPDADAAPSADLDRSR